MTTRTAWTATVQTAAGSHETLTVYAAGRVRAGNLALWTAARRFGRIARGVSLVEA